LRSVPPDESARLWIAAADLYRARFETRRASRAYEKAALVDPRRRGEVAARLAYLAVALGDERRALEHFREAERAGAARAPLDESRGYAAFRRGEVQKAERHFRAALAEEATRPGALAGLGLASAAQGAQDAAEGALELALAADPTQGEARAALAELHVEREQPAEAVRVLLAAPPETDERAALGSLLGRALGDDPVAAARAFASVARQFRGDPGFQRDYADVLEKTGNAEAAAERRRRAGALENSLSASRRQGVPLETSLARLVESFPLEDPSEGEPLRRVGFLGLTRPLLGRERLALLPRPDAKGLAELESALRSALSDRYAVEPVEVPPALARATERLRGFSEGLVDVAGLNRHLRTDALFTARLLGVGVGEAPRGMRLEARLLGGSSPEQAFIMTNELAIPAGAFPGRRLNAGLAFLGLSALALGILIARQLGLGAAAGRVFAPLLDLLVLGRTTGAAAPEVELEQTGSPRRSRKRGARTSS
jgi:Tfp pilus assembly protein PilF